MKRSFTFNSLFFKVLCTVVISVIAVAVLVATIIINLSEDIFIDTFKKSQEKVMVQIEEDYTKYHEGIMSVLSFVDQSWSFEKYIAEDYNDIYEEARAILHMKKSLKDAIPSVVDGATLTVVGFDGTTFMNIGDSFILSPEEILADQTTANTTAHEETVLYQYRESGFFSSVKNQPVIIASKVLKRDDTNEPYGIAYMTIRESEFSDFYNYFVSSENDIFILDQDNRVVSSNVKEQLGEKIDEYDSAIAKMADDGVDSKVISEKDVLTTLLLKDIPANQFRICGVIDNHEALGKMYDTRRILFICVLVILVSVMVVFLFIRQVTRPLSHLAEKMSKARKGELDQYVEIEGTDEVRELSETYNYMLEGLNNYVTRIVEIENEKREAEIHALQMQINPHYIYNTLSSIKWLIWKNDKETAARVIDAFIALLRNTISNTAEFVTVDQEITNLKNYIYINNARYGENIKVSFYIGNDCEQYKIPKLILQPFIENAFFHAFTQEQRGQINVFVRTQGANICFEIIDDGKGMNPEHLMAIREKSYERKEYFSGIGINNVDDRIKLIYGSNYGIHIESKLDEGTTITILLPKNIEQE